MNENNKDEKLMSKKQKPPSVPMPSPTTLQNMIDPTLNHILPSRNAYKQALEDMAPPPPKPKKRAIVDEDTFDEIIANVIKRDYYPHMDILKLQNAYYKAIEDKDISLAEELKDRIQKMENSKSDQDDTNSTHYVIKDVDNKEVTIPKNISLNALGNVIISEDNNSFNEIQEKESEEYKKKLSFLYGTHNKGSSLMLENDEHLLLTNGQTYHRFNGFMFTPSIEDSRQICQLPMIEDKKSMLKTIAKKKKPQIKPENTRFNDSIMKLSDLSGQEKDTKTSSEGIVNHENTRFSSLSSMSNSNPSLSESTNIHDIHNIYNQIPSTPLPETELSTPLMTWGDITSTPQILDKHMDNDKEKEKWWLDTKPIKYLPEREEEVIADKLLKRMKKTSGSTLVKSVTPQIKHTPGVTPLQSPGYLKLKQMSQNRNSSIIFHQGGNSVLNSSYKSPFISKTPKVYTKMNSTIRQSHENDKTNNENYKQTNNKNMNSKSESKSKSKSSKSSVTDGLL